MCVTVSTTCMCGETTILVYCTWALFDNKVNLKWKSLLHFGDGGKMNGMSILFKKNDTLKKSGNLMYQQNRSIWNQ